MTGVQETGGPARDPNQVVEISEKEIEDKIRATMSKIQNMTSKSDRSKFRRGKREAIQDENGSRKGEPGKQQAESKRVYDSC